MLTPRVSIFVFLATLLPAGRVLAAGSSPTFYRDVLPVLQSHCQECHRPGEVAPMPLMTYSQARPWAKAIRKAVLSRAMPPWFADPCCGKFANDRSLSASERDLLARWADSGAIEGDPKEAPQPRVWPQGWNLPSKPDVVVSMPEPFVVPAKNELQYQYFIVPTGFTEDRWVTAAECKPSDRSVVHHAVVYIREPGNTWTHGPTKSDILTVYTPGGEPDILPDGMAKKIPAGSDLVFEMHYTPNGKASPDRTSVGLVFAKSPPAKRVFTLQLNNTDFTIPAGDPSYQVTAWGSLPNDALLLGFLPHMHLRGKAFQYMAILSDGTPEVLLSVPHYDFYWQLTYRLARPLLLKKGTRLVATATYDNSANNPRNPDPAKAVRYGLQSWDEMMVGFFDVAVDPRLTKADFFKR